MLCFSTFMPFLCNRCAMQTVQPSLKKKTTVSYICTITIEFFLVVYILKGMPEPRRLPPTKSVMMN